MVRSSSFIRVRSSVVSPGRGQPLARGSFACRLNQAVVVRVGSGRSARGDTDLREDVADVTGDGLLADGEVVRNGTVGHAGRDERKDLDLAGGQAARQVALGRS